MIPRRKPQHRQLQAGGKAIVSRSRMRRRRSPISQLQHVAGVIGVELSGISHQAQTSAAAGHLRNHKHSVFEGETLAVREYQPSFLRTLRLEIEQLRIGTANRPARDRLILRLQLLKH
jgi:hypothetical protein